LSAPQSTELFHGYSAGVLTAASVVAAGAVLAAVLLPAQPLPAEEAGKPTLVKMLVCVARCQSAGAARLEFEVADDRAGRLQAFYEKVFGWHAEPGADYAVMASHDGHVIEGGTPSAMALDVNVGDVPIYVEVDDLEASLRRIKALGGTPMAGPAELPDGRRWATFSDPEGNVAGLFTPA
jgi:predicted enzyme related to lactoylglutathione lyase